MKRRAHAQATAIMEPVTLVILGAPRTKKNHGHLVRCGDGRSRMFPSTAYRKFEASAVQQLRSQWKRDPLGHPVNVAATFYRDRLTGDAVGYYQALADVLEKAGVLEDDKWIVSWDGSRLAKDGATPSVFLTITSANPEV